MRFRGKLKGIQKDFATNNFVISFEMEEGNLDDADKINGKDLTITAESYKDNRSGQANKLLWECIGRLAKFENKDKWQVYLEELKKYGQYTYTCIKPEAVAAFKANWRECEEIGELEINGKKAVQLLCFFGSSTYNTKEFAQLLDGVIQDLEDAGLPRPHSKELERAYEQWNQYCNERESVSSVESKES